jgi:hypothetical protein
MLPISACFDVSHGRDADIISLREYRCWSSVVIDRTYLVFRGAWSSVSFARVMFGRTRQGELTYARADARQTAWVNTIGKGLNPASVAAAARLLRTIHDRCREKAGNDAHSNGE